jgi:Ca2+-binding RTX toxin-like protein
MRYQTLKMLGFPALLMLGAILALAQPAKARYWDVGTTWTVITTATGGGNFLADVVYNAGSVTVATNVAFDDSTGNFNGGAFQFSYNYDLLELHTGSSSGDNITVSSGYAALVIGFDGNDVILGAVDMALTAVGGDGADQITSRSMAGTGPDILWGDNEATDSEYGPNSSPGGDIITAGGDIAWMYGGGDQDLMAGGPEADHIYGEDGDEVLITGGAGDDLIVGGAGADNIRGGDGNDTIHGEDNDDFLRGGNGDDTINGGNGDDCLDGGDGTDTLNGNAGTDFLNDVDVTVFGSDTLDAGSGSALIICRDGNQNSTSDTFDDHGNAGWLNYTDNTDTQATGSNPGSPGATFPTAYSGMDPFFSFANEWWKDFSIGGIYADTRN